MIIQVTKHDECMILVTGWLYMSQSQVTQLCDIEKDIKDSGIDNICYILYFNLICPNPQTITYSLFILLNLF